MLLRVPPCSLIIVPVIPMFIASLVITVIMVVLVVLLVMIVIIALMLLLLSLLWPCLVVVLLLLLRVRVVAVLLLVCHCDGATGRGCWRQCGHSAIFAEGLASKLAVACEGGNVALKCACAGALSRAGLGSACLSRT